MVLAEGNGIGLRASSCSSFTRVPASSDFAWAGENRTDLHPFFATRTHARTRAHTHTKYAYPSGPLPETELLAHRLLPQSVILIAMVWHSVRRK
jgi:hypothetical protein